MPLAGKEIIKYSDILNQNSLEIKKIASKEWTAKFMPNLKFVKDESFDYAEKIENLLLKDKIKMINGWINLYKPTGYSSSYCLNLLKKKIQI